MKYLSFEKKFFCRPLHFYSSATPFLGNTPRRKYLWELSEGFCTFYSPVNYCSQVFDSITLLKLLLKSIQRSILPNPMVNNYCPSYLIFQQLLKQLILALLGDFFLLLYFEATQYLDFSPFSRAIPGYSQAT